MLALAEKYARLKKTRIIKGAYAIKGNTITFILESGPKLTMTEAELNATFAKLDLNTQNASEEMETPPVEKVTRKRKNKSDSAPS